MTPFATVERDASLAGYEVATGVDDGRHMCVLVYYLDDGTTVVGTLATTGEYAERAFRGDGVEVPNPIERYEGDG